MDAAHALGECVALLANISETDLTSQFRVDGRRKLLSDAQVCPRPPTLHPAFSPSFLPERPRYIRSQDGTAAAHARSRPKHTASLRRMVAAICEWKRRLHAQREQVAMSNDERLLNAFERSVLKKLLAGNHPVLAALRAQLDSCEVSSREFSGVGFFTNLKVDRSVGPAPTSRPRIHVSGVGAKISGLEYGAGFVLVVTDGYLDFLEGFTYDEPWPAAIAEFSLVDEGRQFEDSSAVDD